MLIYEIKKKRRILLMLVGDQMASTLKGTPAKAKMQMIIHNGKNVYFYPFLFHQKSKAVYNYIFIFIWF